MDDKVYRLSMLAILAFVWTVMGGMIAITVYSLLS